MLTPTFTRVFDRTEAQPGDCFFTTSAHGFMGRLIGLFTFSRVAHVGLIVEVNEHGWETHEAFADGLRTRFRTYKSDMENVVTVLRPNPEVINIWKALDYSHRVTPSKYDYRAAWRLGWRTVEQITKIPFTKIIPYKDNPNRLHCSDHVPQAYIHGGWIEPVPTFELSPGDLREIQLIDQQKVKV